MGDKRPKQKRKVHPERDCVLDGECRPPHRGSKSTRHYCKGKVGVEHQWRWMRCADIPSEHSYQKLNEAIISERVVCIACMKLGSYTRQRCGCCGVILRLWSPPQWMNVPDATAGQFITRIVTATY